eukprot:UN01613
MYLIPHKNICSHFPVKGFTSKSSPRRSTSSAHQSNHEKSTIRPPFPISLTITKLPIFSAPIGLRTPPTYNFAVRTISKTNPVVFNCLTLSRFFALVSANSNNVQFSILPYNLHFKFRIFCRNRTISTIASSRNRVRCLSPATPGFTGNSSITRPESIKSISVSFATSAKYDFSLLAGPLMFFTAFAKYLFIPCAHSLPLMTPLNLNSSICAILKIKNDLVVHL